MSEKILIRKIGGDISVESDSGNGTTFNFRLPIVHVTEVLLNLLQVDCQRPESHLLLSRQGGHGMDHRCIG